MEKIKHIEVRYYRNSKLLGTDIGMPLFRNEDGELFVRVNEDVMHPVKGHHRETALKGGWVRIGE